MTSLCVHCGFSANYHSIDIEDGFPGGKCPIHPKGSILRQWHRTNRFTPRTSPSKIDQTCAELDFCARHNLSLDAARELRELIKHFGQHTTDEAKANQAASESSSPEAVGSERLTSAVPAVAGAEKAATIAVKNPATVKPEPTQQHSGDCSIYGADPATNRDSKICDCGYLRHLASSPNPSDADMGAWYEHLIAIEAQYKTLGKAASVERHPELDAHVAGSGGKDNQQTRNESATRPCEPDPARFGNNSGIVAALPNQPANTAGEKCSHVYIEAHGDGVRCVFCKEPMPPGAAELSEMLAGLQQQPCPRCAELEQKLESIRMLIVRWQGSCSSSRLLEEINECISAWNKRAGEAEKERDDLKAKLGQQCEHCGYFAIYSGPPDCPYCGAPNCCQHCCQKQRAEDLKAKCEVMEKALRALLGQLSNIEVLGEWEALDCNWSMRKTVRAKVDSIVEQASAALAGGKK